jgi:hypothetical protein
MQILKIALMNCCWPVRHNPHRDPRKQRQKHKTLADGESGYCRSKLHFGDENQAKTK